MSPEQAVTDRDTYLVDIRSREERDAGLGFIPGSVALDPQLEPDEARDTLGFLFGEAPVALVCTSGSRAARKAEELGDMEAITVLEGGVLGWSARGLPLAGQNLPPTENTAPLPLQAFTRQLTACFVGELANFAIDENVDPVAVLAECCKKAAVDVDDPTEAGLRRLIDHAAAYSRRAGTPVARVAENVDAMLGMLDLCRRSAPEVDEA